MIQVKFYHRHGFVLCVVNTGSYDFDDACLGLVGSGTNEETAKHNLFFQIKRRLESLTERIKGEAFD